MTEQTLAPGADVSRTKSSTDSSLSVRNVSKRYGEVLALDGVSLEIPPGSFATLLGPSGCGKTTLLRIIGGFEVADSGSVTLGGKELDGLAAESRPVNTVFQSYALFPHLSVKDNIAFGLRARKVAGPTIEKKVSDAVAMFRLEGMTTRHPHQLSGGQRQRVALARALVNEPSVLLLDEPMSALDARLRTDLQLELRELQKRLGKTFVLVTHDQDEAMTMSDLIFVMDKAKVIQAGSPSDVYDHPRTAFVASFLGSAVLLSAERLEGTRVKTPVGELELREAPPWSSGQIAIRPERVKLTDKLPEGNGLQVRIIDRVYRGDHIDLLAEPQPKRDVATVLRIRATPNERLVAGDSAFVELSKEHIEALVV